MLWCKNCCFNPVSTKRRHGSGRNSQKTRKPVRNGKRLSRRRTLRSDAHKLPGKEKKNLLEVLLYLERHLRNPTRVYGDKIIKRRRGLPSSQIKFWNCWKDIRIISQQRPRKRLKMEAHLQNWLLVWGSQLILSPDNSKKSSVYRNKLML